MRPPSYYTSLANSHTHSPYSSPHSSNRNSSQQLRSSFSNSSSTSYATRTHLPFVPQTMLVAHCYTGVGSTTKPYGQASSSVYSAGSRFGSVGSTASSYSPSSLSSRPLSTKRHLPPSSSSSYTPRSSVYLSSAGTTSNSSSNYRRPSAYTYQPIRLRERPLLTRISDQISGQRTSDAQSTTKRPSELKPASSDETDRRKNETEERDWSSDVARNISRNKYLIKFREFDKPRSSIVPDKEIELPLDDEKKFETSEGPNISVTVKLEETNMRVPPVDSQISTTGLLSAKLDAKNEPIEEDSGRSDQVDKCDKTPEATNSTKVNLNKDVQEATRKTKAPKEKRNIKLKIKNVKPDQTATGLDEKVAGESPALAAKKNTDEESPKEAPAEAAPPTKAKVKRLIKKTPPADGELKSELRAKDSLLTTKKLSDRKVLSLKQLNLKETRKESSAQESGPAASLSSPKSADSTDSTNKRIRFREYNYGDFNFLSVLGHGGWGFVILAELKNHNACFAVKCIKKITIVEDDDFDSIMIERKVLTLGNVHPFICKLFCTFETEGYLFFAMEYCAGGDLMFHVQRDGKFTEARSRFYAAEIICAIKFLHNQHIIYRDLKLDNILLDSRGHIRLVDFGMCQCRTYREEMLPSNFCGTPEYISPEIIKGVPYNHSVDWWSFGVLLYEMAVGKMPFRGNDENELLWNVCYEQIHYPMFLTKELTSLLQSLLEREPTKRMGMSTCKAGDIYDQAWFKGVDWRAIEELRIPPPFVPDVTSERDVQNFDSDFTQSTPELSPIDESTLKKIDQSQFQKFPYTNPNISIFG